MKTPLQLMFYGHGLDGCTVTSQSPGIRVTGAATGDSPNYLFVDVEIEAGAGPGEYIFEFERGGVKWTHPYTLMARRDGSAVRKSYSSADLIYLLMPDRFANGDPSNDTSPLCAEKADRRSMNGRHGGDIQGIVDHMDYMAGLGVTALWSTPLLLDNEPRVSYHGYACADYYTVDPRFGTNELYRKMVSEAHRHGIKVIMDVVTNHCGMAHPWMRDLPYKDWVNTFASYTPTNHAMNSPADPNGSPRERSLLFNGWFDRSMPDINLDNPHVLRYFTQWAVWWIEWADLDGLRVDTYPYNSQAPMARWVGDVLKEYPNLRIVGECWLTAPPMVAYWDGAARNHDGFSSHLPSVMDFPLQQAIVEGIRKDTASWNDGIRMVYDVLAQDFLYHDPRNLMIFADNHDTDRLFYLLKKDPRKVKLAMTLVSTMRGIPQLYVGTEQLFLGDQKGGHGGQRIDFPGGWPGDSRDLFSGSGRTADESSVYDHCRKVFNWRKGCRTIHEGKTMQYLPHDNVYVFFRYTDAGRVMVVVNCSHKSYNVDWIRYSDATTGFVSGKDIVSGRDVQVGRSLTVEPLTSMIIEMKAG